MRFFRRFHARSAGTRHVILYGKPGCHLCDDARVLLDRLSARIPLEVEEVDIRSDPALFRRYDIHIPVIAIDGGPEMRAPIDFAKLLRALEDQDTARV